MLNRTALATFVLAGALAAGCSSSGSTPQASPTGGTSSTPTTGSQSPKSHPTTAATTSISGKPSTGATTAPPNPDITKVDQHLDAENRIISKLAKTPAKQQSAVITRAFNELSAAMHVLQGGISGVPASVTQKFTRDLQAALSQESKDKQCVATRSKSLCASVTKTSNQQFGAIAADRKKLDSYQG